MSDLHQSFAVVDLMMIEGNVVVNRVILLFLISEKMQHNEI